MMLRFLTLVLLFCCGLAQAANSGVLQRPVSLDTGSGVLKGTLLLPRSDSPVPVVLLIAGSGPTDRDGNNPAGKNDSLKRLALLLAKNRIASVRYDKRGVAQSYAAQPDERKLSVDGYVADAVAWSRQLQADSRLGPLILLGHSEGALIASLAAAQVNPEAVISLAGSARPIDQVLTEQLQARLPRPLLPRALQLIATLKAGQTDANVPDPLQVIFRPSVQPYLISLFRQDPAADFARLTMPALIVQGRNDMQVSSKDAQLLKAARPDAELALIDGMNHVLRIVPNDLKQQLDSYDDPSLPLAAQMGRSVVGFIQALPAY
ncbi:Serine aminopeptidase, S33 [compost metagenome]